MICQVFLAIVRFQILPVRRYCLNHIHSPAQESETSSSAMLLRINILSLLVMLARAPRLCDALTYRLDASCVARPGQFTVALNEAIFMARSAADRLSSETDRLHQSYFQLIFKQPARNGITSPLLSQLSVASSNAIG